MQKQRKKTTIVKFSQKSKTFLAASSFIIFFCASKSQSNDSPLLSFSSICIRTLSIIFIYLIHRWFMILSWHKKNLKRRAPEEPNWNANVASGWSNQETRSVAKGGADGRVEEARRCGASTCVCHTVCHNSKLKLCCLPIAIASRVFIWLPRFMPSAWFSLSRCR